MDIGTICIIIPCYNEGSRIDENAFTSFALANPHIQLLLIDDGSTDCTLKILQSIKAGAPMNISVSQNSTNLGKAETIRNGIINIAANMFYDYIGFWDADLSTPLEEISWFTHFIELYNDKKIFIGSRWMRLGANIQRISYRHIMGRVYATAVANMLNVPVYDSQCGAKIFKKEVADLLFTKTFVSKWFFDVELFYRYKIAFGDEAAVNDIYEVPLRTWTHKKGSKLKPMNFILAPLQLLRIRKIYKSGTH